MQTTSYNLAYETRGRKVSSHQPDSSYYTPASIFDGFCAQF